VLPAPAISSSEGVDDTGPPVIVGPLLHAAADQRQGRPAPGGQQTAQPWQQEPVRQVAAGAQQQQGLILIHVSPQVPVG